MSSSLFAKVPQDVALVLLVVSPAHEVPAPGALDHLGVMTRRHRVKAQSRGSLEEHVELDVTVALDTGVRRLPVQMALDERGNHVTLELFGVVKDVVINAQDLGDATRVVDIGDRAATRVRRATPQLQGGAGHLVTRLQQQGGRDRRVDSPTHRYENFHVPSLPGLTDIAAGHQLSPLDARER